MATQPDHVPDTAPVKLEVTRPLIVCVIVVMLGSLELFAMDVMLVVIPIKLVQPTVKSAPPASMVQQLH